MLETRQERVKLLKAGITGKTIERLYIAGNNFKIVCSPVFLVEIDMKVNKNIAVSQEDTSGLNPCAAALE